MFVGSVAWWHREIRKRARGTWGELDQVWLDLSSNTSLVATTNTRFFLRFSRWLSFDVTHVTWVLLAREMRPAARPPTTDTREWRPPWGLRPPRLKPSRRILPANREVEEMSKVAGWCIKNCKCIEVCALRPCEPCEKKWRSLLSFCHRSTVLEVHPLLLPPHLLRV